MQIVENQTVIDFVYAQYLDPPAQPLRTPPGTGGSATIQTSRIEDGALLAKIRTSKQADKFNALMDGDYSAYSSQSEADMALCSMLAFWTGKNAEQMDRLFRQGGLFRAKWDEQHGAQTYGAMTIAKAISVTSEIYLGAKEQLPYGFHMVTTGVDAGLYFTEKPKKDELPVVRWLGPPLYVMGLVRDAGSSNWGQLVEWNDADGEPHRMIIPYEFLSATDSSRWRAMLAKEGWVGSSGKRERELLPQYLINSKPSRRLTCVPRTGWVM